MAKSKSIQTAERYLRFLASLGMDTSRYSTVHVTKSGKIQPRWNVKEEDVPLIKDLARAGREFKKIQKDKGVTIVFPDIAPSSLEPTLHNISGIFSGFYNAISEQLETGEIVTVDLNKPIDYTTSDSNDEGEEDEEAYEKDWLKTMHDIVGNLDFEYDTGDNKKTMWTENKFDDLINDIKSDLIEEIDEFYYSDPEFATGYWSDKFSQIQAEIEIIDLYGYYSSNSVNFRNSFTGTERITSILTGQL